MFILSEENRKAYKILNEKEVPEQNLSVVELEHIVTKARIVLFICDDENRVFNIVFKTPVENGKGTPHILEHSVLCGSRKYNIKDPFIELAKSSLNTFLNVMRFPDKTCYPVASAILKDFHNLVDVYLDAVFYPNAIRNDKLFKQEGWHYEIENENDDLNVNGVVYNEMKGVYSDPNSILESAILANLFRGTNYAHDYGGNPKEIIDLTYDEFKEFHHKYYSATNSIIYFYGKLDFNEELANLQNNYLKDMEKVDIDVKFSESNKKVQDSEQIDYYNIDVENTTNKSYLAYNFVLPFEKTSIKSTVMSIINYVLFKSDAAILKEKLMNDGFGETVESHLDTEIKNSYFSIIAKNVDDNKKDSFKNEILSFIKNIVDNGIDVDMFKAGINYEYFSYAEGEYGKVPRGLLFSLISLDTYLYGDNPTTFIEYKEAFDYLKSVDLNDKNNIFVQTLREVFLENKWTALNVLKPKYNLSKENNEKLSIILKDRKNNLNVDDIKKIVNDVKELKDYQKEEDSEDAKKAIPRLRISDIDRYKSIVDYETEVLCDTDSIVYYKNNKDIIYFNICFDISNYSKEELYLAALVKSIIAKIDLDNITYKELNNYIDINTGGLEISIDTYENKSVFVFSLKSTNEKIGIVFDILYKILSGVNFNDKNKIELLLNELKNQSLLLILSSGHSSSLIRSSSADEYSSFAGDKISKNGIAYNRFINAICKTYNKDNDSINKALLLIFKKIISSKMYFAVCNNKKYFSDVKDEFVKFKTLFNNEILNNINVKEINDKLNNQINEVREFISFDDFDKKVRREAIVTPNDVNFCAVTSKFDKELYSGKLFVLNTLFNYEYLWTNIRVLGGAYGCMSRFKRTGNYGLVSYRDPNVSNTNKVFYDIPNYLKNVKKSEEEMEKYIIGSIGVFDNPISTVDAFSNNVGAFFNNQTDEEFNLRRQEILDMKSEDLNKLVDNFKDISNANSCALIAENKLDEAKNEYDLVWQLMEQ